MSLTQYVCILSEPQALRAGGQILFFQYSNIPIFQHSNWGEAPNLYIGFNIGTSAKTFRGENKLPKES
ncbi:hypothetical protein D1AOALGA4SA_4465 [Olavius algarvensis Delta 1 endosymbiont]|nr:hypothetical protein D1AOALGA4SA_4465 [Olavius algarvensis Delta 1 endosymbiont]